MTKTRTKILIIDDESDIRMLLSGILEDENYQVLEAQNATDCFHVMNHHCPDIIILDIWLEGSHLDGIQILKLLKKSHPELPIIMISGHGTIETAVESLKLGAYDFIEKPFKSERLLNLLKRAFESKTLRTENQNLKEKVEEDAPDYIQGISPQAKQITQKIIKLASSQGNILIQAPPGSGKGFFAEHIHTLSNRSAENFLSVHCNMMNEKNFTTQFATYLVKANHGTLHLIECTELSIGVQKKLAALIQKKEFLPASTEPAFHFDIRFFASTNQSQQSLQALINKEELLPDFYYRLNTNCLTIPPLTKRRQDIMPYFNALSERAAQNRSMQPITLSPEAKALIELYNWPGNIRQLENIIAALYLLPTSKEKTLITPEMLPKELLDCQINTGEWQEDQAILSLPLKQARDKFERDYIKMQIERFGGNISQTAQFIGMERSALHRKVKSLKIEIERKEISGLKYIA